MGWVNCLRFGGGYRYIPDAGVTDEWPSGGDVGDGSGVSPQFQRAFARLDEVRAQYHADRERVLAEDEARQARLRTLVEENKAKDEQTLAAVAARETVAPPPTKPEPGNAWATRRTDTVDDDDSFGFEEDPPAAQAPPTTRTAPAAPPAPTPPPPRTGGWDEDDFSGTDWTSDEPG
ncbi:hypothetical protein FB471_2889 [Amycolatopsis cihanbeyliensis]|uniref:Uncharacterized protein n=1 Tax=Amycolatopsis cihanbeyliensis TaxID=1128664 RepID=A0A542DJ65_AMYCI|nr:hypothetical protein FB471_2889 [Amycolatopsis cihanbeyliensis]